MTNIFKKMFKDIVNWNKIAPPVDHWNINPTELPPTLHSLPVFIINTNNDFVVRREQEQRW